MLQVELFTLIRKIILEGLERYGHTGYTVKRGYQWTKQGAPADPGVFFYPVFDRRIGSPKQLSQFDPINGMQTVQAQCIEADFQIYARVPTGKDGETLSPTSSDIAHLVADVFMSELVIKQLQAQNVGVLRVVDVTPDFEENDKGRHEQVPVFQLTLSYTITRVHVDNVVESIEPKIYRV